MGIPDISNTGSPILDLFVDVGAGALVLGLLLLWQMMKKRFVKLQQSVEGVAASAEKAAQDAAVAREHTENSHASSKTPNLRDDMDYKHSENRRWNENIARMIARMEETARASQARTDKELSRINDTLLDDREATRDVAKKLDAHIEQKLGFEQRITEVESKLDSHRKITEAP